MGILRRIFGGRDRRREREHDRIPGQGVILKRGEECYCDVEGALIEQKVTRKKIRGGSAGMSVRVSERVRVRASRFAGEIVPETALVPVSIGRLVITNRRVLFRGNLKSFSLGLDKIMGIETFADAVRLTVDSADSPRIVQFTDDGSAGEVRDVLRALYGGGEDD